MAIPILGHLKIDNPPTETASSSGTHRCGLTTNNNFSVPASNEATTIQLDNCEDVIGQSGVILITNPGTVTSLSFSLTANYGSGAAASNILTPGGSTISYKTTASNIHMLSYYVAATNKVVVNYIGMLA